jgi:hypothetical protein
MKTCRCGHTAAVHQHYRPGSDCGLCDCARYWRRWFGSLWHRNGG